MIRELKKLKGKSILYLFPERNRFMDKWQRWHFIDELSRYGVDFDFVNPYKEEDLDYESVVYEKIKSQKGKYSLFMTAMNDYQLSVSFINSIKELGLPTLLICWDNLSIPFYHKKLSAVFDLVWLTSYETQKLFKKWGGRSLFLPYAANPYVYKSNEYVRIPKVAFIGSPYGIRARKISQLAANEISIDVFGSWNLKFKNGNRSSRAMQIKKIYNYIRFDIGRKCLNAVVRGKFKDVENLDIFIEQNSDSLNFKGNPDIEEMVKIYSSYALSLGVSELLDTYHLKQPIHKVHLRTFEIPMCGGIQVTSRIPEIENYFEDRNEILLYDDEDELVELCKEYLSDRNERQIVKMGKYAHERAINEHTWFNRFKCVQDTLF